MEYFLLEHPPDRLILCNRSGCENIADYLEVNEQRGEDFAYAAPPAVKGMLQFWRRAYPVVPNRIGADLMPDPQATQIGASQPATFQPMLLSDTSRAVMPYACTTVQERGSPLQTRTVPGLGFSAASIHVIVSVMPVLIST